MSRRVNDGEKNSPFKRGIVKEVDGKTGKARVEFQDEHETTSFWLNVNQKASSANKSYWMPDVGSQVNCLIDWHGEDGSVLGSFYSEADPPPTEDAGVHYERYESGLEIIVSKGGGDMTIRGAQNVRIEAAKIVLVGEVHLGGDGGKLVHRKDDLDSAGDQAVGSATKVYAL